jgi:hypothetical protein
VVHPLEKAMVTQLLARLHSPEKIRRLDLISAGGPVLQFFDMGFVGQVQAGKQLLDLRIGRVN